MKKKILLAILLLICGAGAFVGYRLLGAEISAEKAKYIYIRPGDTRQNLVEQLTEKEIISHPGWFNKAAGWFGLTELKPGRYAVKEGMNLYRFIRMLRSGDQSPVKLVIVKERTRELFAGKMGKKFDTECDSLRMIRFINNNDSLGKLGLDTNSLLSVMLPYTYEVKWNSSPAQIISQFQTSYKKFWTTERTEKASRQQLTPYQVMVLASIVEEETNRKADKYNIASTYLNRFRKDMKLEACPTAKYVSRNFLLDRITEKQTSLQSPYNTYQHKGLPPGPICTPSIESIEAVLDAPSTNYLFFVASYTFDGSTIFTENYTDHMKFARMFQAEQRRRADSVKKRKAS